jgi:nitrogen fixation/metabolism regulation signal transduction histidine kinase
MEPGVHEYRFIVDGIWHDESGSAEGCTNEFGRLNCVFLNTTYKVTLRGCKMIRSFQKQPQIKILHAFSVNGRLRLRETDLSEVVRTVESVLPQYVNEDIDVTITLLEKNLKIMADMALMKENLTRLIKNTMDGLPGNGHFSLNTNRVNFEVESLLDSFNFIAGACAFVYLADRALLGIDEKIRKRIGEPFFTIKSGAGKSPGLPIAYRIIKKPNRGIRVDNQWGQGEVDIYLPLTKPEIKSMMSIPIGVSGGRNVFN